MHASSSAALLPEATENDGKSPGRGGSHDRAGLVAYLRRVSGDPLVDDDLAPVARAGRRVLLIEDNEADARYAQALLRRSLAGPVDVTWVRTIGEAEAIRYGQHHDVVLLDLGLPDGVGIEAVRAVRRFTANEALIVLSGNGDEELALAAVQEGAQDYLVKGTFDGQELNRCVRHAIARVESDRKLRLAIVKLLVRSDDLVSEIHHREDTEDQLRHEKQQLADANSKLIEADQVKTNFLAAVSHELRTPLTSIIGYVELTTDDPGWSPSESEALAFDVIDRNSRRLLALVEELLEASALDSDRVSMTPAEIDITDLVKAVVDTTLPMLLHRSQRLSAEFDPDLPVVWADGSQIERVLLNLLDNARKFSPDSTEIVVRVRSIDSGVAISVTDQGPGIPADEQAGMFERFARGSKALRDTVGGTGLGLAIAKAIVDEHQGEISVESAPGAGTTITFTVPSVGAVAAPVFESQ